MGSISKVASLVFLNSFSSCTSLEKFPYSIKDFDKPVQPYLMEVVQGGILDYYIPTVDSIQKKMTIKVLKKLSKSEHPTLRVLALRLLVENKDWDPTQWIKKCLTDTAVVVIDNGELVINYVLVADEMLWHSTFRFSGD